MTSCKWRSSSRKNMCWFFFFSSRRRHTRCLSDWSSDVCSSDLIEKDRGNVMSESQENGPVDLNDADASVPNARKEWPLRSEERRVGKECRARRWPEH